MDTVWQEIAAHYEEAKKCFWGSQAKANWHRDESAGRYHLWNAYYKAVHAPAEGRDDLLYARVLSMMSDEQAYKIDDYTILHEYLEPAVDAYDRARAADGPKPTEKEYEKVRIQRDALRYKYEKEDDVEGSYKNIQGLAELKDFGVHDSTVVSFEHTMKTARLCLDYYGNIVTIEFSDIYEIRIDADPMCTFPQEFSCYSDFYRPELLYFDIGEYRILCSEIRVVGYRKEER